MLGLRNLVDEAMANADFGSASHTNIRNRTVFSSGRIGRISLIISHSSKGVYEYHSKWLKEMSGLPILARRRLKRQSLFSIVHPCFGQQFPFYFSIASRDIAPERWRSGSQVFFGNSSKDFCGGMADVPQPPAHSPLGKKKLRSQAIFFLSWYVSTGQRVQATVDFPLPAHSA